MTTAGHPGADASRHAEWLALASASPVEAIERLEVALADARRSGDLPSELAARRALGIAERSRMRLSASLGHLTEAITLAQRHQLHLPAAQTRITLAGALMLAGRSDEALRMIGQAVAELPEPDRSQAMAQRVTLLSLAGFNREALEASEPLLDRFTTPDVLVWAARLRGSRSMIHLYLGNPADGIREAEAAIDIYERIGNHAGVARTRHNIAALRGLGGDVLAALELFTEVEVDFHRLDIPLSLGADGKIATLFAAGLVEDAAAECAQALREHQSHGATGFVAEAMVWHALALANQAQWAPCATAAAGARQAFDIQSRPAWESFAAALEAEAQVGGLAGAAMSLLNGHALDGHIANARSAAEAMRAHGWVQATRASVVAALVLATSSPERGAVQLAELASLREADLVEHQLLGWLSAGAGELVTSRSADAVRRAGELWRTGAALGRRDTAAVSTLDGNLAVHAVSYTLSCLAVAATLRCDDARSAAEWILAERSHAPITRLRPGSDAEEERLLAELRAIRLQAAGPTTTEVADALLRRQPMIERQLRGLAVRAGHLERAEVVVADGTTQVVYVVDDDEVVALVAHGDTVVEQHRLAPMSTVERLNRSVRRGAERLAADAGRWTDRLDMLTDDLRALDLLLVAPWLGGSQPGSDTAALSISVPAALDLTWCALPSMRGRAVSVRSPSRTGPASAGGSPRSGLVAIAGPGLPHAIGEVERISRTRSGLAITGASADRLAVLHALGEAATVHLASHASFRSDQPLFSSLELADGPLFLHDIALLHDVPPVIVLAACGAGRVSARAGGGATGLCSVLTGLGAEVVVAPQTSVNDALAETPMALLHVLLDGGLAMPEALARLRTHASLSPPEQFTASLFVPFVSARARKTSATT